MATRISALSTEYLRAGVFADSNGRPVDPTDGSVAFAFTTDSNDAPTTWHPGSWDTTLIGTYVGQVLVGPAAAVLPSGVAYVWVRVVLDGETVIRQAGTVICE